MMNDIMIIASGAAVGFGFAYAMWMNFELGILIMLLGMHFYNVFKN